MRIVNCLHPVRIVQNGSVLYVPCNKCVVCSNRRRAIWSKRLKDESRCHKHCFFVTLTYSDDYVPMYIKVYDKDGNFSHLYEYLDGEILDNFINWFNDELDKKIYSEEYEIEKSYFDKYETFCHPRFKDVQRLCKSLYAAQRRICGFRDLRFFVCSEIGSQTHRVHYHGLFWTNSDLFCEHFEGLCRYYWAKFERGSNGEIHRFPLCDSRFLNIQYSFGSCESYVSKYVAKFDTIPLVYNHPALRPSFVSSRKPPIGCFQYEDFLDEKSFFNPTFEISRYSFVDCNASKSLLPSYLRNKMFERCLRFESLSFFGRVSSYFGVYNICQNAWFGKLETLPSFDEFVNHFIDLCRRNDCTIFSLSFEKFKIKVSPSCTNFYICLFDTDNNGFISFNQIRRYYYLSSRVFRFCRKYDLTFIDFVQDVDDYYKKLDYLMLCYQLKFECDYVERYPLADLIFLFPEFLELVAKSSHTENYFLYRNLSLSQFGIDYESIWSKREFITRVGHVLTPDVDLYRKNVYLNVKGRDEFFDYDRVIRDTFDFKDILSTNKKIYNDITSSTFRNDKIFSNFNYPI